jgi:hypothetical protein
LSLFNVSVEHRGKTGCVTAACDGGKKRAQRVSAGRGFGRFGRTGRIGQTHAHIASLRAVGASMGPAAIYSHLSSSTLTWLAATRPAVNIENSTDDGSRDG